MPDLDAFGPLPSLETDRILLRNLSTDDAQDLFEYASDSHVAVFTAWTAHESIDASMSFLSMTVAENANATANQWTWGIVYKESNKLVGTCFLSWSPQHSRAEVGYAIGYLYWGRCTLYSAANSRTVNNSLPRLYGNNRSRTGRYYPARGRRNRQCRK